MTISNELDEFRIFAKRLSRKQKIRHHEALDIIAMQQGHPNWRALMKAWNQGWRPDPWDVVDINESTAIESPVRGFDNVKTTQGEIAGERYTLQVYFDEVLINGSGWEIHLDHAPSVLPEIETYTKPNPLDDEAFLSQVMKIAREAIAAGLERSFDETAEGRHDRASLVRWSFFRMVLHALRHPLQRGRDGRKYVALPEMQCDSDRYPR